MRRKVNVNPDRLHGVTPTPLPETIQVFLGNRMLPSGPIVEINLKTRRVTFPYQGICDEMSVKKGSGSAMIISIGPIGHVDIHVDTETGKIMVNRDYEITTRPEGSTLKVNLQMSSTALLQSSIAGLVGEFAIGRYFDYGRLDLEPDVGGFRLGSDKQTLIGLPVGTSFRDRHQRLDYEMHESCSPHPLRN